jgi:hypothetical protein
MEAIKDLLFRFLCLEFWSFSIVSDFVVIPKGCFARVSNLPCQIYGKAKVLWPGPEDQVLKG